MFNEITSTVRVLLSGGIILYPTDTIWGLGCDATNEVAIRRIFRIKKRSEIRSLLVLADSIEMVQSITGSEPEVIRELMGETQKPTTIIYPQGIGLSDLLKAEDGSIGIRLVKDEFCKKLINSLGLPIVSTTANYSGYPFPGNYYEIPDDIKFSVDYIVDWNKDNTANAIPSRVVKLMPDGTKKVIRA